MNSNCIVSMTQLISLPLATLLGGLLILAVLVLYFDSLETLADKCRGGGELSVLAVDGGTGFEFQAPVCRWSSSNWPPYAREGCAGNSSAFTIHPQRKPAVPDSGHAEAPRTRRTQFHTRRDAVVRTFHSVHQGLLQSYCTIGLKHALQWDLEGAR